jgi:hypothetical protein
MEAAAASFLPNRLARFSRHEKSFSLRQRQQHHRSTVSYRLERFTFLPRIVNCFFGAAEFPIIKSLSWLHRHSEPFTVIKMHSCMQPLAAS